MRCRVCNRPALFRAHGKKARPGLHADKDHDLCQRCFRDLVNAERAQILKYRRGNR